MESFTSFFITKKFPSRSTLRSLLRGPLTGISAAVYGIFFALCATIFILIITINSQFLTTVPARGGTLVEGVIGSPHSINPVLATTATDKRLVALVYGSLMTKDQDDTVASFATDYTVSPDGTIYTVTLRPNLRFDDGKPLTSDDVVFTVQKMQNSTISTSADYWQHVAVESSDASTIVFTLPAADTTFVSHLTFGILPKHVWENVADESFATAQQNLKPVGAGAFKVASVQYADGMPSAVTLSRNGKTNGKQALLHYLKLQSFSNQTQLAEALNAGDVDFSYTLTPDGLALITNTALHTQPTATTQEVSVYRSSKDTALANPTIVAQLGQIIDKNAIIATVQHGYGAPVGATANSVASTSTKRIPLSGFSIAVENDPTLLLAAHTLAQQLQSSGVTVTIRAFDPGVFQQYASSGTFTLFMARSNDIVIPAQYSIAIPLYTESLPYTFTTATHTIIPNTLESPSTEYGSVTDWYTNTDKLWKWFIRND